MTDDCSESKTTTATFRFASGQILTLDEDQIEKIPYLAAMVSSADRFESARNNDGHYKLDPHINHQDFPFVLQSLSFHSVRQLFTCLPKENNVIPIIALLDFLGLGPKLTPTLNDVDSTFFASVVYSPLLQKYVRIVKPLVMQDMAVLFAIAMVKEEYNFMQCEVMDQIYWFVMFILSTRKWFGPRLRYHVCKTAENYFALFKPSLLKSLQKLGIPCERETRKCLPILSEEDASDDEESNNYFRQTLYYDFPYQTNEYYFSFWYPFPFEKREQVLLCSLYEHDSWFWCWGLSPEKDPLKLLCKRVLEIVYEQLQTVICQFAIVELRRRKDPDKFVQTRTDLPASFHLFERKSLPEKIEDILKTERVQEEIRAIIIESVYLLTPKLEQRYAKLVKSIREYEQISDTSHESIQHSLFFLFKGFSTIETMQEKAFSDELFLDRLHKDSHSVMEQVQQRVLAELQKVALNQFNQWKDTQRDIDELESKLNSCQQSDELLDIISKLKPCQQLDELLHIKSKKIVHHHYQKPMHNPLPKRQFKHSMR